MRFFDPPSAVRFEGDSQDHTRLLLQLQTSRRRVPRPVAAGMSFSLKAVAASQNVCSRGADNPLHCDEVTTNCGEFVGNAIFSVTCPVGPSVSTCPVLREQSSLGRRCSVQTRQRLLRWMLKEGQSSCMVSLLAGVS